MLKDQDRIFTNLYGMHDRTLAGAKKRGHWNGTGDLIKLGRDKLQVDAADIADGLASMAFDEVEAVEIETFGNCRRGCE